MGPVRGRRTVTHREVLDRFKNDTLFGTRYPKGDTLTGVKGDSRRELEREKGRDLERLVIKQRKGFPGSRRESYRGWGWETLDPSNSHRRTPVHPTRVRP